MFSVLFTALHSRFMRYCLSVLLLLANPVLAVDDEALDHLFDLSLQELLVMKVKPAATLTLAENRLVPASVTRITGADIAKSAARDLDELLEMYVPGFLSLRKNRNGNILGIRGINSDRNNKLLLLVNGRVMNAHTNNGVLSERMFSMLGDIAYIDIVRGPGSAIYGPGAIAGVISIVTLNGDSFSGADISVRQGLVERFTTLELRYGKKLGNGENLFFYAGIDKYDGADQEDAPLLFSHNFRTAHDVIDDDGLPGYLVTAGEPVDFAIKNDRVSSREKARYKLHAEYNNGPVNIWARYTNGSVRADPPGFQTGAAFDPGQIGYQQFTLEAKAEQALSRQFRISGDVSYDVFSTYMIPRLSPDGGPLYQNWREYELFARFMSHWTPNDNHIAAFGVEYSSEQYGKAAFGFPHEPADLNFNRHFPPGSEWSTDMWSVLAEYQWQINEHWTTFIGGRVDEHRYTQTMYSPRGAIIFAPNDKDVYKLVINRSVRRADDMELYDAAYSGSDNGEFEDIEEIEFRYERQHNKSFWFAFDFYRTDFNILSFDQTLIRTALLGNLDMYGVELEAKYISDTLSLAFSHNYTKEIDFTLRTPETTIRQNVSASPYGYGDDLANWSNHISKLVAEYKINGLWTALSSLRIYWGFPGGEDLARYNEDVTMTPGLPIALGADEPFEESAFLNLGMRYQPDRQTEWQLSFHNALGWFDKDFNKRNYYQRTTQYRLEAAALSLHYRHNF